MKKLIFVIFLLIPLVIWAKDPYPVNPKVDVLHYTFELQLNDHDNNIEGRASILVRFNYPENQLSLDLIGLSEGMGMSVNEVIIGKQKANFQHKDNRLTIDCPSYMATDTCMLVSIEYSGQPKDGLIISQNKFGNKSFFGDNWPDRGRNWIPCVDHVSDKATVEFKVIAPKQYKVVAVGYRKAEYAFSDDLNLTHYVSTVPLPTKVMVIGVSTFDIETVGFAGSTPVETWVYPENRDEGFLDYKPAVEIMDFFSSKIGPYAFEKLANVQSKTVYGGMENSGAIFYYEGSVTGKNRLHSLLAHEIAHQWFGDAVTEKDWHHIWLSEGFATYLEAVCMSEYLLRTKLYDKMSGSRSRIVSYYYRNPKPVIDTTITNFRRLLSTNSYQKGAWVLHMLRQKLGEDDFWNGIKLYYARYMNSNALTSDFRHCMEETSKQNLKPFFDQWLRVAGHPIIEAKLIVDKKSGKQSIRIIQKQEDHIFMFPLEIKFIGEDANNTHLQALNINQASQMFSVDTDIKLSDFELDPDVKLLFEMAK